MMLWYTVVFYCCLFRVQATEESPSVIIIGSGAAGIAAGVRLLENEFDVKILEAEDRIGGRVYSKEFGGHPIDIGGQWVSGEENNAVFEMAWPLGVLERSPNDRDMNVFDSEGERMPKDVADELMDSFMDLDTINMTEEYRKQSTGDWFIHKLDEYFDAHPEIRPDQREPLTNTLNLMQMAFDSADTWFDVAVDDDYEDSKGDQMINWKDKSYGLIIDILLKKYPNPDREVSFRNQTILNAEVSRINYDNPDGKVHVITSNGDEHTADHVIFTPSLGVLKADHKTMFNPPLSDEKVRAIETIGFGSVAKIFLFYSEPWWPQTDSFDIFQGFEFFWTDKDKKELENDPIKSWLLGFYSMYVAEHKPGVICCWLTGPHARQMESLPEETVFSQLKEALHRFLGKAYNLTEPTAMLRSLWYTNKHFRGTYSYKSVESRDSGSTNADLEEPVIMQDQPKVLFAGEATSFNQSATVHGAIVSGWREADRLLEFYYIQNSTSPSP